MQGYFPDFEDKWLDANALFTKWLRMAQDDSKSGVDCGFTTKLKKDDALGNYKSKAWSIKDKNEMTRKGFNRPAFFSLRS